MKLFSAAALPVLALRAHWLQALKRKRIIRDFSNRIGVSRIEESARERDVFPRAAQGRRER